MNPVDAFLKERDTPYVIPLTLGEFDASCSGKASRLWHIFREAGYEAQYRVCTFRWSDISLPSSILAEPHDDIGLHVYLEVKMHGAWIIVDPTWDPDIQSILPVNEWDGASSTRIAVPVLETFSPERSEEIMRQSSNSDEFEKDIRRNGKFYNALNEWLDKVRKSNEY